MNTIAAIATAAVPSAIGVVRVSGPDCFAVCEAVFRAPGSKSFAALEPRKMVLGDVLDAQGRVLDHGLAVRFPAPHSYTGEDCAEFHCHGSPIVLQELLDALFAAGARQARAGEFTRRAFLNGQLDLTEAEAVIDLIEAETAAAARNAAGQLSGSLRRETEGLYQSLLDLSAQFYAVVDYPDEDIEDLGPAEIRRVLTDAEARLSALLATCARGRILKSGVATAIVGRPNAGKSSLLNALAGYDRCLVTNIPGTTRDTVEESVVCGGVRLRLIDTAGIRETEDTVERLGVERSRRAIESAELVIVLIDSGDLHCGPLCDEDQEILALAQKAPHYLIAASKSDLRPAGHCSIIQLPQGAREPEAFLSLSSVAPDGLRLLEETVAEIFPEGEAGAATILTNARQEEAASRARDAVVRAQGSLDAGLTPDAALADVEDALSALGELTGRTVREDLVDRIFARFCVGK